MIFNKPVLHVLFICGITFFAYVNTFSVPFQFDDVPNIVENPLIKQTHLLIDSNQYCEDVQRTHGRNVLCKFFKIRYVGFVSFAINYALHGLNVAGYHIVNLVIHILNSLLVYSIIILSFRTPLLSKTFNNGTYVHIMALSTSLLFALHPVQTQAVTYIVQRFTSLATMFYLTALVCYVKWRLLLRERNGIVKFLYYVGSLIFAVMSMKTKEIGFTLPVIIAVYEFIFFKGVLQRRILFLAPLMLTLLVIPYSLIDLDDSSALLQEFSDSTRLLTNIPRLDYLFTEFSVIITYVRLLFLPINQNLDYDYPLYHSFFNLRVFVSFVFLSLLFSTAIYFLYRLKKMKDLNPLTALISFGILWFFVTLSVESSIIPIIDVIFEHRMYLPSIGVFTALTASVFIMKDRLKTNKYSNIIFLFLVIFIIALFVATVKRNFIWQDKVSLWQDVIKKSPQKARGYDNLASAYLQKGELDRSIDFYQKALIIDSKSAESHYNLGYALILKGDITNAKSEFEQTIVIKPTHSYAFNQLGNLYLINNELLKAKDYFKKALDLDYGNLEAHYNYAIVSERLKDNTQAVYHYKIFIKLITPEYEYLMPEVNKKLSQFELNIWQR